MSYIQIAIDGPAGSGKSTIAKKIAQRLNITYIDTGAMYRALTYKVLINNINIQNKDAIVKLARESDIKFSQGDIYLDNKIVNEEIRSPEVNKNVSYIANSTGKRNSSRYTKISFESRYSNGWKGHRNTCA